MAQTCAQHPDVAALFICDGCESHLCRDCVEPSSVLVLCKLCGERALPLFEGQAALAKDLRQQSIREQPYSLKDAIFYPVRGGGLAMLIVTIVTLILVIGLRVFGMMSLVTNLISWVFMMAFVGMIVGLQFKIARTTADGDNEIPDWPEFTDFWTLFQDLLTWFVIRLVFEGVIIAFVFFGIAQGALSFEPRIEFWLGFALAIWLGTGFMVMAFGAVGNFRRLKVFAVHSHIRGFLAGGADAVKVTNLVFFTGALTILLLGVLIAVLGGTLAVAGPEAGCGGILIIVFGFVLLSLALVIYWLFLVPHLSGILFRRHHAEMEKIYWS